MWAKLEKLLTETEDCGLIGRLATDPAKQELFKRLDHDLRIMADDIGALIGKRTQSDRDHGRRWSA